MKLISIITFAIVFTCSLTTKAATEQEDYSIEQGPWQNVPWSGLASPSKSQRTINVTKNGKLVEACTLYKVDSTGEVELPHCILVEIKNGRLALNKSFKQAK